MFQEFEIKNSGHMIIISNKNKEIIIEIENGILLHHDMNLIVDKPEKWREELYYLIIPCDGPTGPTEIRINQVGDVAF